MVQYSDSFFFFLLSLPCLFFPLLDCLRRRRLSTTSRDNQVQPEVFEMFNTAGSWVSLCAASHSACVCVYDSIPAHAWRARAPHLLSWDVHMQTFLARLPRVNPGTAVCVLVCVCVYVCARMHLSACNGFPLKLSLKPVCSPFCVCFHSGHRAALVSRCLCPSQHKSKRHRVTIIVLSFGFSPDKLTQI